MAGQVPHRRVPVWLRGRRLTGQDQLMSFGALGVVQRWLDAVNERDNTTMEALSAEQVELAGPAGQQP